MEIQNKTEQITADFMERIRLGSLRSGDRIPPERELSESLGVSREILRRAMANLADAGLIERRRRAGTFVTANAMRSAAEVASTGSSPLERRPIVGVALHHRWSRDAFFMDILAEFESRVRRRMSMKLFFHDFLKVEEYRKHGIDVLFVDHGYSDSEVERMESAGLPTMVLLRQSTTGGHLFFDNLDAGYQAGKLLAEHGHRLVAYLNIVPIRGESELRAEGYGKAEKEFGLSTHHVDMSMDMHSHVFDIKTAMEYLFAIKQRFTGIVAPDDQMAFEVYDFLENRGVTVPDQVSVVGFGGNFASAHLAVPLSTLAFPVATIVDGMEKAVRQCLECGSPSARMTVSCSVMSRDSVRTLK